MLMLIAGVSNVMFLHNTLNTLSVHSELDQKFRRNFSVLVFSFGQSVYIEIF